MKKNNYFKSDVICMKCNQKLMEYIFVDDDDNIVLGNGLSIACHRCKRVVVLKKYTQSMIKNRTENGNFRI